MNKIIYISFCLLQLIACRKDDITPGKVPADHTDAASNFNFPFRKLVSNIVESTPQSMQSGTYAYDDHHRIAFYITDEFNETFNYLNENNIVITRLKGQSLVQTGQWKAVLNDMGAITRLEYVDGGGRIQSIERFEYDHEGYMLGRKFLNQTDPAQSYEEKFTMVNGLLKKRTHIVGGLPQYEINYTYGSTRTALMLQTAYAPWISKTLFGKTWERVATACQQKDLATNKVINEKTFECTVDEEGYVISKSTRNKQHSTLSVVEISY